MALSTTQYGYIIDPMVPFTDGKGNTIKDGFVRVFVAGSSTPVITYRNFDGSANQDLIELDNSGRTKTSVIGSKGLTYKVCVYDQLHSQESPILTVDKVSVIGSNITAGAGATVVTGLDGLTTKPEGFVDASVIGTDGYVALDHTLVTDDLNTDAKATAVENDRYIPLLNDDVNDPDSKITLGRLWQWVLGNIKSLSTTITSFRKGDVIPVDGPSGTAKMGKDDLLRVTTEKAQQELIDVLPNSMQTDSISVESVVWEQGSISSTTGDNVVNADRLRTKSFLDASFVHKLSFTPATISTIIRGYDSNKNYVDSYCFDGIKIVQSGSWSVNEPYTIDLKDFPSIKYFRILQKDSDYEPITPSDNRISLSLVTKNLSGKTFEDVFDNLKKEMPSDASLNSVQRSTSSNDNYNVYIEFELGTIDSSGVEKDSYTRVRSNFVRCRKGTLLSFENATDPEGMYVVVYDDNKNYVDDSAQYVTEYVVNSDCYIRLRGKSIGGVNITDPSVYNFNVVVKNVGAKTFDDVPPRTFSSVQTLGKFVFSGVKLSTGQLQPASPVGARAVTDFLWLEKGCHIQIDTDWNRFLTGGTNDNGLMLLKYNPDKSYIGSEGYSTGFVIETTGLYRIYLKTYNNTLLTQSDLDAVHLYPKKYGNYAYGCGITRLIKSDAYSNPQEQNIYSRYDALVSDYPANVSKNLLGYATASGGGDDTNFPIYEYVFAVDGKPTFAGQVREVYDAPTILLTTLVHGNESVGARSLLKLFEKMMAADEGELLAMRGGFTFKVIPIVNPCGYANNTRNNARNVNINRNFAPFFDIQQDADKGASPYSENESLIVHNWMAANPGCYAYFDIHDTYVSSGTRSYHESPNVSLMRAYCSLIRSLSSMWHRNYGFGSDGKVLGYVDFAVHGNTFNEAFFVHKILNSALFECGDFDDAGHETADVMYAGYELVANYLNMIMAKSWTD